MLVPAAHASVRFFIIFLCCLTATTALALEQVPLDIGTLNDSHARIIDHVYIYQDQSRTKTYRDMHELWQQNKFQPLNSKHAGQGLTSDFTWIRFTLHNSSPEMKNIVLEYVEYALPYLDIYSRSTNYPILEHHGQQSFYNPTKQLDNLHTRYNFNLKLEGFETRIVYGRMSLKNLISLYPDLRIWDKQAFDTFRVNEIFSLGILLGVFTLCGLTCLALFFFQRKIYWLALSVFIFSSAYAFGGTLGFLPIIFFTEGFHWKHMAIAGAISISAGALYTRSLLQTKKYLPRYDKLILLLALFGLVPIIFGWLENSMIALPAIEIHIMGIGILMVAGYLRANQGDSTAIYFTLIWSLYVANMTIIPMRDLGIIDHNIMIFWVVPVVAIIEAILLIPLTFYRSNSTHKTAAAQTSS